MKTFVDVLYVFPGIHNWPYAPDPIDYLRSPHRHDFHVRCIKQVSHDDRDVEFFHFQDTIALILSNQFDVYLNDQRSNLLDLGDWSCERLAKFLLNELDLEECSVYEDGSNGAIVKRTD